MKSSSTITSVSGIILTLFFCCIGILHAESDLTARLTHANAGSFPVVEAILRIYNPQPFELNQKNCKVWENADEISDFRIEKQSFNHYLIMVIDRSSSIEKSMPDVKKAAARIVRNLAEDVNISILSFASDIDFNHKFSRDATSLINAIGKMRPWGGTALFDGLYEACEELHASAGLNDLKTVICLTDGHDSTPSGQEKLSRRESDEVKKYAIDKNIRIITLGLGDEIDPAFLSNLASETGGWYLQTATSDELEKLCENLSERIKLKRHYRLIYNSPTQAIDGKSRTLKIIVSDKSLEATASRQFHIPARVLAQIAGTKMSSEAMSVEELLDHYEIFGELRAALTRNIRLPVANPVTSLSLAAFSGLSVLECRNLINHAQQKTAAEHELNYSRQKSHLDAYLNSIDQLLKLFYNLSEKPGNKADETARIEFFLSFLQLRRSYIELIAQKAYEEYLLRFKATSNELEYFEKTQVALEKLPESFFNANTASLSANLADIENRYAVKLEEVSKKLAEKFRVSSESPTAAKAGVATQPVDLGMPTLREIKTIDR